MLELRKYIELDSLRFFSVTLVGLHHLYFTENKFFLFFTKTGDTGVDIFFTISGFIITLTLMEKYIKKQKIEYTQFIFKRILRLWPSWIISLLISTILVFLFSKNDPNLKYELSNKLHHYFLHFGNYSYGIYGKLHHLFGHYWSLAVEEHFYLLWPPVLLFLERNKKFSHIVFFNLLLIPFLFRILSFELNQSEFFIKFSTHTRFDSILTGCLIAYFGWHKKYHKFPKEIYTISLCVLSFYVGIFLLKESQLSFLKSLSYTMINIGSGLLIILAFYKNGIIKNLLSNSYLAKLGILSYGVYLFHIITNTFLFFFIKKFDLKINPWIIIPISLILPYIPAYLTFKYLDHPMMRLRSKWFKENAP
ncbi:acyltransferase [bacterium]|nr:acyltransferase [bacterium]